MMENSGLIANRQHKGEDSFFVTSKKPVIIGCLGGGIRQLENDVRKIFGNEKQITRTVREMQKTVLLESESIIRKVLSGLLNNRG